MRESWRFASLEDVCDVRVGRTPRRDVPQYWGKGAVWVTVGELSGGVVADSKEHISQLAVEECMPEPVPPGTLLFSFKLSIGKMGVAGLPLYTNEAIAALPIRDPNTLSRDFLKYALSATSHEGGANEAVLGRVLNRAKVAAIRIPLPPLPEQERIVRILDAAEELRRLRAEADRRTADLIPALFYEMFGDPATRQSMVPLSSVVQEFRYGTSNKSSLDGYPALRIPNVIGNALDLSDLKYVKVSTQEFERLGLKNGDILFVRTNGNPDYIGRSAIFESPVVRKMGFSPSCFIYASYLIRARLELNRVDSRFLQHYLCSEAGTREVRKRARTSAGQYNINTEGLGSIPVPLPPLPLQRQFAARVVEIRALQEQQAESRRRLDDLFASLLHRAFQGEL